MENIFEVTQEEKDRIRGLHLTESKNKTINSLINEQETTDADTKDIDKQVEELKKLNWVEGKQTDETKYEIKTLKSEDGTKTVDLYRELCGEGKVRDKNTGDCIEEIRSGEKGDGEDSGSDEPETGAYQDAKLITQLKSEISSTYKSDVQSQKFNLYNSKKAARKNIAKKSGPFKGGFVMQIQVLKDPETTKGKKLPMAIKNKKGEYTFFKMHTNEGDITYKFDKPGLKLVNKEGKRKVYYPSAKFLTAMKKLHELYEKLGAQLQLPPAE